MPDSLYTQHFKFTNCFSQHFLIQIEKMKYRSFLS